jgi:riboflavin kinase/FMN adenylyltransferase
MRPLFEIRGPVIHGEKRGRTLGFPTANLLPEPGMELPASGVYAALANGLPAVVSIGLRPTFETKLGRLVEAHLLDFDGDLYGQELHLEFLERLRDEVRFDGIEPLVAQLQLDVRCARDACSRCIDSPPARPSEMI